MNLNRDAEQTILAFDFGTKRIGIAVGQTISRTARAVATVRGGATDWVAVAGVIDEWAPDSFVVGMPSTADGRPHPLAALIERFARQLRGRFGRPVEFVDECLSSTRASERAGERNHGIDALAAQVILETWLNDHPGSRPAREQ